jgi:hypothetical protein
MLPMVGVEGARRSHAEEMAGPTRREGTSNQMDLVKQTCEARLVFTDLLPLAVTRSRPIPSPDAR